uniref:Transposase n=1 Tax=Romanomermis culicivorax TaxID=13658 RepID=A0A915J3S7_ROMCU
MGRKILGMVFIVEKILGNLKPKRCILVDLKSTEEVNVELDESLMDKKAKNERDTLQQTHLLFGIVQRSGRKCVLYLIDNASKENLLPLIEKHIPT